MNDGERVVPPQVSSPLFADVTKIVLGGGGARGLAYAGVLEELQHYYDFWSPGRTLKVVCGCSIGALYAVVIACGGTASDITAIARSQPMRALIEPDVKLLVSRYGLDTGDSLMHWVDGLIAAKTGRSNITFRELFELTGVTLEVATTNLQLARSEYMSHVTAPDMRVSEGATISMSLPPLFVGRSWRAPVGRAVVSAADCGVAPPLAVGQRVRLADHIAVEPIDDAELPTTCTGVVETLLDSAERARVRVDRTCTLVDGGLMDNFPMRRHATEGGGECLGMRLMWKNCFDMGSITSYFSRTMCVALTAAETTEFETLPPAARRNTVVVDTGPVDTVDINLGASVVEALIARGRLAMLGFIETRERERLFE